MELKPCPFCGRKAKIMKSSILENGYHVHCSNSIGCGAKIDGEIYDDADEINYLNKEQIIAHWNTRPEAQTVTVEEIEMQIITSMEAGSKIINARGIAQAVFNLLTPKAEGK